MTQDNFIFQSLSRCSKALSDYVWQILSRSCSTNFLGLSVNQLVFMFLELSVEVFLLVVVKFKLGLKKRKLSKNTTYYRTSYLLMLFPETKFHSLKMFMSAHTHTQKKTLQAYIQVLDQRMLTLPPQSLHSDSVHTTLLQRAHQTLQRVLHRNKHVCLQQCVRNTRVQTDDYHKAWQEAV